MHTARNPVLDAIVGVLKHTLEIETLVRALDQAKEETFALGLHVEASLAGLPATARGACAPEARAVSEALDVYRSGLAIASRYATTRSPLDLTRGAEFVRRAWMQLDPLLIDFRNAALRAAGPSEIPDYNYVYHLYMRGDARLAPTVEGMRATAVATLARAGQQPPSPERALVLQACERQEKACAELVAGLESCTTSAVEAALVDLYEALSAFPDLAADLDLRARGRGPTASPRANHMLSVVEDYLGGLTDDTALQASIEDYCFACAGVEEEFLAASRGPASASVEDEIGRARAALSLQTEGIGTLYRFLQTRDVADLERGRAIVVEATSAIDRARRTLGDMATTEGRSRCLRCGELNELSRKSCGRCGARLMHAETMSGLPSTFELGESAEVGEHVARLLGSVNRVADGRITRQQFEHELDAFEERLRSAACAPPDERAPDTLMCAALEYHAGVEAFREGLEGLRAWLRSGSRDQLAQGTRQIWEAHGRVRAAWLSCSTAS